jgi:ubiquinone/menaquinone biosynthesis C-methylase UbiE
MAGSASQVAAREARRHPGQLTMELLTAVSMTAGRGTVARAIISEAQLTAADRAVDIGCGPGTAVREAARRGAPVTGVDPSAIALRLARALSRAATEGNITWAQGSAEHVPLLDQSMTVAWSISSVHHWQDRAAGFAEILRVLAPGGRVLLSETLQRPGSRGHATHRVTRAQAEDLARALTSAGFTGVSTTILTAGRRTLAVFRGERPGPPEAPEPPGPPGPPRPPA